MTMSRTQRSAALTVGGVTVVTALFATTANVSTPRLAPSPRAATGESLANFVLEHPEAALMRRHLPLAFVKEKLENGGESVSGPSQEKYENRAFPRSTIADMQRRGARSAYQRLAHNGAARNSGTATSTSSSLVASSSSSSA